MKKHVIICLVLTIAGGSPNVSAQGFGFVTPQGSFEDGNSSTLQPLRVASSRYQQSYGFQSIFSSDAYVNSVVFRLDGTNGSTISSQLDGTLGLATYFAGTIDPEPAPLALTPLGLSAFVFSFRKRKQTKA